MRIAFASIGEGLESSLSPHFGRCPYYVFVDVDGKDIKSIDTKQNPFYNGHQPGVVPQFVAQEGANVIVAGGMGPRAIDWFNQLGVTPITTIPRKINDILKDYMEGKLAGAESCKDHDEQGHHHN